MKVATGLLARKSKGQALSTPSPYQKSKSPKDFSTASAASPERKIVLSKDGADFRVAIIPPIEGEVLDARFPAYKQARGWAGGIRMTRGWRMVDTTAEGGAA